MSSLEQRIATWRARLGEDPIYGVEDLDELEGHLRESIPALVQKGLSEEEAFWVAAHRLGDAAALGEEYGKVSTGARSVLRIPVGKTCWPKYFLAGSSPRQRNSATNHRRHRVAISTFEGVVENGQIRLRDNVTLPEHTKVYVVIPDLGSTLKARVYSPRLVRPEQAGDFAKQVIEVPADAKL